MHQFRILVLAFIYLSCFYQTAALDHKPQFNNQDSLKLQNLNMQSHFAKAFKGRGDVSSVYSMIERVLEIQNVTDFFELSILDSSTADSTDYNHNNENGFFVLSTNNKIGVKASSAVDLAYGVGWYLREYCNMSFSWERAGGNQLQFARMEKYNDWPRIENTLTKQRGFPISYIDNVCTFSYSYVWYSWKEWEKWIDWAALSGINLVIAYTGQEELWRQTFNDFGVSDEDFMNWTNGPAYLTWSRGQSMHGVGSPLSLKWMKHQWNLQKRILKRLRSLGVIPVLPTFQGNMPPIMKSLFPSANISITGNGKSVTSWLDGLDPLFQEIQAAYMEKLIKDFGTDHWYEADGYFNQAKPPWLETGMNHGTRDISWSSTEEIPIDVEAQKRSNSVYNSMAKIDPNAIWFFQGWIWRGWSEDRFPYMKGWISGVPLGKFVILDMVDESPKDTIWNKFYGNPYFGAPFIWSVLHNFGGNLGMRGSLQVLNEQPFAALNMTSSVIGTGAAPEGIDQNPLYYTFLSDVNYRLKPFPSIQSYLKDYTISRYGRLLSGAIKAWTLLLESVYNHEVNMNQMSSRGEFLHEKDRSVLVGLPYITKTESKIWYDISKIINAWRYLIQAVVELQSQNQGEIPRTLKYDVVNVGREALSQLGISFYISAVDEGSLSDDVVKATERLLELQKDADRLLCTEESFMAWPWFELARKLAKEIGDDESKYLVQARSQTSTWSPVESQSGGLTRLHDYANKAWAGQLSGFYSLRLSCFRDLAKAQGQKKFKLDRELYENCIAKSSYQWTHDTEGEQYPMCKSPQGDIVYISRQLLAKYATFVDKQRLISLK